MQLARRRFLRIDAHIVHDLSRLLYLGLMPNGGSSEFDNLACGPRLCHGDRCPHRPGGGNPGIGDHAVRFAGSRLGRDRCTHRPGVVGCDSILFAAGFVYNAMSANLDFWIREPSRAGLPAPAQQALLKRLAGAIDRRTKYFPGSPLAYVGGMKELLLSTFLPQKGPIVIENAPGMASEVLPRRRTWELAYLELSAADAKSRPRCWWMSFA